VTERVNKYPTYKDLPAFLKDEEGNNIGVHGYIISAQIEVRESLEVKLAEEILNTALTSARNHTSEQWIDEWLKTVCRLRGI